MTDNILKIRTLIDRFFEGETTLAEEQVLYDFFRNAPQLPEDLEAHRQMFLDFAALSVSCDTNVMQKKTVRPVRRRWLPWAVAASVTVLLLGGVLMLFQRSQPPVDINGDELVAYIYGERTTDPSVVLAEMQTTMVVLQGDGSDVVEEQLKAMFDY